MKRIVAIIFAFMVLGVLVSSCEPEPTKDCENICSRMVELYSTALGSAIRPANGVYGTDYLCAVCPRDANGNPTNCLTGSKYCCPLSWETYEKNIPFLEAYTAESYLESASSYSSSACTKTCEYFTFASKAPSYTSAEESFDFKECLNNDPSSDYARKLYKMYPNVLGIFSKADNGQWVYQSFGDCMSSSTHWPNGDVCKSDGTFAGAGLRLYSDDLNKLNSSCNRCKQQYDECINDPNRGQQECEDLFTRCEYPVKNMACVYHVVNNEGNDAILSCWLLQACRAELQRWIEGEERM